MQVPVNTTPKKKATVISGGKLISIEADWQPQLSTIKKKKSYRTLLLKQHALYSRARRKYFWQTNYFSHVFYNLWKKNQI